MFKIYKKYDPKTCCIVLYCKGLHILFSLKCHFQIISNFKRSPLGTENQ